MRLRKAVLPVFSACILIVLFIIVFFPMSTTESPRRPLRMFWSWLDPTLSAAATKIWVYSSSNWHSFASYAIFFSAFDAFTTISWIWFYFCWWQKVVNLYKIEGQDEAAACQGGQQRSCRLFNLNEIQREWKKCTRKTLELSARLIRRKNEIGVAFIMDELQRQWGFYCDPRSDGWDCFLFFYVWGTIWAEIGLR